MPAQRMYGYLITEQVRHSTGRPVLASPPHHSLQSYNALQTQNEVKVHFQNLHETKFIKHTK